MAQIVKKFMLNKNPAFTHVPLTGQQEATRTCHGDLVQKLSEILFFTKSICYLSETEMDCLNKIAGKETKRRKVRLGLQGLFLMC